MKHEYTFLKTILLGLTSLLYLGTNAQAQLSANFEIGLSTDSNICGNNNSITVDPGTDVTVCYKIANTGSTTIEKSIIYNNYLENIYDNWTPQISPANSVQIKRIQPISSTLGLASELVLNDYHVFNYRVSTSTDSNGPNYDFIDISTTGLALNLTDDGEYTFSPLPFSFEYNSVSTNYFRVGNNGAIHLAQTLTEIPSNNTTITSVNEFIIAPFWDDLIDTTGNIYVKVVGTSPNRKGIIQWNNLSHVSGSNPITFQVHLFETSNEIQFHYQDVDAGNSAVDDGKSATVGIGSTYYVNEYSLNQASLSDSFAISFFPKKVSHRFSPFINGTNLYNFDDISATGTALNLADDDNTGITMPFTFNLGNGASADLSISNNGAVRLGTLSQNISWQNIALENDSSDNIIAPYWADLNSTSGNVYYQTKGTAPQRRFIVQWHQRPIVNVVGTENVTFQLKLFESSNEIEFQYQDLDVNDPNYNFGQNATIGIRGGYENSIQYSYNYALLPNTFSIYLKPYNTEVRTTATATIIVNAPDIDLPNSTVSFSQEINTTSSQSFDIDNIGMYPLNWTILENFGTKNIFNTDDFITIKSGTTGALASFNLVDPSSISTILSSEQYLDSYAGDFYANNLTQLYVLKSPINSTAQLLLIDIEYGDITVIANTPAPTSQKWTGMSWNRTDGKMYALASGASNSSLHTIDVTDGSATLVKNFTQSNLNGLASVVRTYGDSNKLYSIDTLNNNLVSLGSPDFPPIEFSIVGALGYDAESSQSLEFDDTTQTLYWLSCSTGGDCGNLRTFTNNQYEYPSSSSTILNQIGTPGDLFTLLARRSDIECNNNISWLSITNTNGTTNSGMTDTINYGIDTNNLPYGIHDTFVCIKSNDPDEPTKIMQIQLEVTDSIFKNSFEGIQAKK